jgi:primase-polymerase (primpol)-like protein
MMRRAPRWVRHRKKVPLTVNGAAASSTNPATWSEYDIAATSPIGDGVGFVLNGDGIACIDLDHCLIGGVLADWAAEILAAAGRTYVEISPSGEGLHIFGLGVVGTGRRRNGAECYDRARYMTVTAQRYCGAPVKLANIQAAIDLI